MLRFRHEDRERILEELERDVEVLQASNLMDYSLLFAAERNPLRRGSIGSNWSDDKEEIDAIHKAHFANQRHRFLSVDGKYIYHIGIIDYLQDFNFEKQFESTFKTLINKSGA